MTQSPSLDPKALEAAAIANFAATVGKHPDIILAVGAMWHQIADELKATHIKYAEATINSYLTHLTDQVLRDEMASIPKPLPPDWGKVDGVDFGDNAAEPMTHSNDVTEDTSLSEALAWLLNNYGDKSKLNKETPND